MGLLLSRVQILAADDLKFKEVATPEWAPAGSDPAECFVRVRCLTGTERDAFEAENYSYDGGKVKVNRLDLRARLLARSIVGPDNKPLFTVADVAAIGAKSGEVLDRLFDAAEAVSGLSLGAREGLEKNSASGQSAASTSGSPASSDAPSASSSEDSTPKS